MKPPAGTRSGAPAPDLYFPPVQNSEQKAFNGNTRVADQAWKKGQKVYEGYYPQFIRQKDTTVAGWIFNDFFSGTYDVYKWSSLI